MWDSRGSRIAEHGQACPTIGGEFVALCIESTIINIFIKTRTVRRLSGPFRLGRSEDVVCIPA